MSVVFSGTNQGRFTSTGIPAIIQLRSDVDWIKVYNLSVLAAGGANTGAVFYWQRGFGQGTGIISIKTVGTNALQIAEIAAPAGFYLIDSSVNLPGALTAVTAINGNGGTQGNPLLTTGNTNDMRVLADDTPVGVVRLYNIAGGLQLGGVDFSVGRVVNNVSYDLLYAPAIVNAVGPGTYRMIPYNPLYYPRNRFIGKIAIATTGTAAAGNPAMAANQALVTLTVTHGFTVGQRVRFVIPSVTNLAFGMTELNGVSATIIAINDTDAMGLTNTIRVNVDVSAFAAFVWPLTADTPFTFAQVVPVGEDTAAALSAGVDILGDSTVNTGYMGIQLQAGTLSPAGVADDVIYWVAGKSFDVNNI
jgi:hypothetical protein